MTTIYLVRHGEKEAVIGDPPLTNTGREQAEKVGKYLKQFPVDVIYASPLKRTQETAEYISKYTDIPFLTEENLRERANWGDDAGQSFEDFLKEWRHASENRDFQPKIGDSSRQAGTRLEKVIRNAITKNHKNIVLVTHGGIIADFLINAFEEHELDASYKKFSTLHSLAIKECSITIIIITDGKFTIKKIADVDHLR